MRNVAIMSYRCSRRNLFFGNKFFHLIIIIIIIIIIGVKLDKNAGMTMYQNQSTQVMKVRLPYYGTNKCEPTDPFLTINRTSQSVMINKEHAC